MVARRPAESSEASHRPVEAAWRGLRVGAELEFFVVDRETFEPRDHLDLLIDRLGPESLKPEIAREHIELLSPAVGSMAEMEASLRHRVEEAGAVLAEVGAVLLPLAVYDTATFTPTSDPRYHRLLEVFGAPFWDNASTIVADQVNVGAEDEAGAFRVFEAMTAHLPLFMGLSCASPFRDGRPTDTMSNRMRRYDACVTRHPGLVGVPPRLRSMADYNRHLAQQPVLPHPNMFYRYVRPMPQRGVAAEVRCIDKQPTLAGSLAFVALALAIAMEALSSTATYALDAVEAEFLQARERGVLNPSGWRSRLDELGEHLPEAERRYLAPLFARLESGPPAVRLRAAVAERGMQHVMGQLVEGYLSGEDGVGGAT